MLNCTTFIIQFHTPERYELKYRINTRYDHEHKIYKMTRMLKFTMIWPSNFTIHGFQETCIDIDLRSLEKLMNENTENSIDSK